MRFEIRNSVRVCVCSCAPEIKVIKRKEKKIKKKTVNGTHVSHYKRVRNKRKKEEDGEQGRDTSLYFLYTSASHVLSNSRNRILQIFFLRLISFVVAIFVLWQFTICFYVLCVLPRDLQCQNCFTYSY